MKGFFRVRICPCCGQPTCVRNDAEKYFKKVDEDAEEHR